MACVNADGTVTESGRAMLLGLKVPATAEALASTTGLPLFRIRSGLRDMAQAGLVVELEGAYRVTERGEALAKR
jgi:predicted transcriptional regulator